MKLLHFDCPAKSSDNWRAPEFVECAKQGHFALHLQCPACHMVIAVTVLKPFGLVPS
jgi:hypothetical protein